MQLFLLKKLRSYPILLPMTIIYFVIGLISNTSYAADNPSSSAAPEVIISINGIDGDLKTNALAYLELKKNLKHPHFSEVWLKKLHNKAEENIRAALEPFGYYQARVSGTLKKQQGKNTKNSWLANYTVITGPAVKIIDLKLIIRGAAENDPEVIKIISNFPIQPADTLHHGKYEKAKEKLIADIEQLGYAQIKAQKTKITVDPKNNTAKLYILLEGGSKFYLGGFSFNQDILHEDFIEAYIKDINTGDPLSQENLLSLQDSLLSSGYFSSVDIKPQYNQSSSLPKSEKKKEGSDRNINNNKHVPIDITLKPAKRHKLTLGAGYDTEIEANVSFRWQHRRLNHSGHNTDIYSKLSAKKSFIKGAYWIPVGNPHTDKIGIIPKFETEDTDNTDRDTFDLETGYWFSWKDWDSALFTEYKYEKFISGDEPETRTELLSLGLRMEKVQFEKALFPRKGWALYGEIRTANTGFLSDIDYISLYLKSRLLLPVTDKGRLILRTEVGMAETSDFDQYPSSLRFYAGGDHSVRGYKWKALGPKDDKGNVIGGRNLITGSIEYNHQVSKRWVVAGFLDAGNAYNDKLDKIYFGAGFGTRWIAPFGLIRADMGFPLQSDDEISEDPVVFYFGFEVTL